MDPSITLRSNSYLSEDKELRDILSEQRKIPGNCKKAPKMDPEIEAILTTLDKKKGAIIASFQDKLV